MYQILQVLVLKYLQLNQPYGLLHLDQKVYDTVISRNVRLSEAPSFGKPIILYDILSTGAENYMSLAKEVLAG